MTDRMGIGALWEETAAFFRAELALVVPVALAGFGAPLVVLLLAVPADQARAGTLVPGPWMLWFLPAGLFAMIGTLAISAMALTPGASVGESLRLAVLRVPTGLGLIALDLLLQLAVEIPVVALRTIDGGTGIVTTGANVAILVVAIWLSVRVLPIWALVALRPIGPIAAVRAVFAATRGRYRALLLVRVGGAVAGAIAFVVLLVPIRAVFDLIGLATGGAAVTTPLSFVAAGASFAMIAGVWTVFCARLYRRLAGSISGI